MGRRLLFRTLSRVSALEIRREMALSHGSWSKSRSYAASSANERGASFGRQKAGGSCRSCCQIARAGAHIDDGPTVFSAVRNGRGGRCFPVGHGSCCGMDGC